MHNKPSVLVMMATYNGSKYVAEQIESILSQEGVKVTLQISDDGSTDATASICSGYAERYENVSFRVNQHNKGVAKNFMDMVYEVNAADYDYYAFSDQDDYWLPEKLKKAIGAIKAAGNAPWLYYSDVCNTDEQLQGEGYEYRPFAPFAKSLKLLLTVNWASGCTMVFNSAFAAELQKYEPKEWPRIHDGWVHLVALSCGWALPDLEHAYIKRRISGQNQVGERGFGAKNLQRLFASIEYFLFEKTNYSTKTVAYLLDGYRSSITPENLRVLERFSRCPTSLKIRFKFAFDGGFKSPYGIENIFYIFKMLTNKF